MKIALVKQEIYQDLYVCPVTERDAARILFSSNMRVGPIGLMAELGADFFIVKEENEKETQIYRKVIPHLADKVKLLKTLPLNKVPGWERRKIGSILSQGELAVNGSDIDWGQYDIVISINISLPTHTILKYPQTLFAYMIGEANMATFWPCFGYDAYLNQNARGIVQQKCGIIDFPYTFLKGDTLQAMMQPYMPADYKRKGVFMEINSTKERPVTKVPDHFKVLEEHGFEVILHQDLIFDNLKNLCRSKYFVKMGGRTIRGNSAAEAISCGALAIMNRNEVIHKELIIDECHVTTMEEVLRLINELEQDELKYNQLLKKQKEIVTHYFYDCPLQSIENCLEDKRSRKYTTKYSSVRKFVDRVSFINKYEIKKKLRLTKNR
ncbi:hypothetical protein [uncultured Draconibacterium sp.]|uniref:hypothetical protein n=1 Tax=uncultured Draconibacterium sp. TaxID=1573823 RepID=UPI0032162174